MEKQMTYKIEIYSGISEEEKTFIFLNLILTKVFRKDFKNKST